MQIPNEMQSFLSSFCLTTNDSGEVVKMEKLVQEASQYNIYEVINSLSALNLVIENQNKSILLDALIAALLCAKREEYISTKKFRTEKLRKIVENLNRLSLKATIDPAENGFVERILYWDNYWVFPGINEFPTYSLQALIDVLCSRKFAFNSTFELKANLLLKFVLDISNGIATRFHWSWDDVCRDETKKVKVPSTPQLESLKESLVFTEQEINRLLPDEDLQSLLYCDFGEGIIKDTLQSDKQPFFDHPFLKTNNSLLILLNPSLLCSFAFHSILILAEHYGEQTRLIRAYNEQVWRDSRKSLYDLAHKKIKENDLDIELIDREDYKEVLLSSTNDSLLLVRFICDCGEKYSTASMFEDVIYSNTEALSKKRYDYFVAKLKHLPLTRLDQVFVLNFLGRNMTVTFDRRGAKNSVRLHAYQLRCVAINEQHSPWFIPRYIRAKSKYSFQDSPFINETDILEFYSSNKYSFYASDNISRENVFLYFPPGDGKYYALRAIKKQDRHLLDIPLEPSLQELIRTDEKRPIYAPSNSKTLDFKYAIELDNLTIWIYTPEAKSVAELNLYSTITDTLAFWFAECNEAFIRKEEAKKLLHLGIKLGDAAEQFEQTTIVEKSLETSFQFEATNKNLFMTWYKEASWHLNCETNMAEKRMMLLLLKKIEQQADVMIDWEKIEATFSNPLKKKFLTFDVGNRPYLKPVNSPAVKIPSEEEELLLDEIGKHFFSIKQRSNGKVPDDKRIELTTQVVDFLYSLLQKEVEKLNPMGLFEKIYYDLESTLYKHMTLRNSYAYSVACYPEKADDLAVHVSELSKASTALKFLAEYVTAKPPAGTTYLGMLQYDRLLAICSQIINWAYQKDLFTYYMINSPMSLLPSGRLGMPQDESTRYAEVNIGVQASRLTDISSPGETNFFPSGIIPKLQEKVDDAFEDEYGFTFKQFTSCIMEIIEIGEELPNEVKQIPFSILLDELERRIAISQPILQKIISQISLSSREDYLHPPEPYRSIDVYPWRFNRELSFVRRPILLVGNNAIWGNRNIYHMWVFTIDLIIDGKYKARKNKLKKLIGELSKKRGDEFNTNVANKLQRISSVNVRMKVSKINGKRICNEAKQDLGDIDVLFVIPSKKEIVVCEVKDFSMVKNPYEVDQEYKKLFVDTEDKLSYVSKHKRRVEWVREHTEDVSVYFGIEDVDTWTIKDLLIVSAPVVSNLYYDKKQKTLTYSELDETHILNL